MGVRRRVRRHFLTGGPIITEGVRKIEVGRRVETGWVIEPMIMAEITEDFQKEAPIGAVVAGTGHPPRGDPKRSAGDAARDGAFCEPFPTDNLKNVD